MSETYNAVHVQTVLSKKTFFLPLLNCQLQLRICYADLNTSYISLFQVRLNFEHMRTH